ncbi:glycoside hydrolase family 2 protein [Thozetella sp. PMI_491]|nr:glycoside hydrolase family 2 protein [Thozetella sp. PMI_491]
MHLLARNLCQGLLLLAPVAARAICGHSGLECPQVSTKDTYPSRDILPIHLPIVAARDFPTDCEPGEPSWTPAATPEPYNLKKPPLDTPWTLDAGTEPWPQHPRPQLYRTQWRTLNGVWTYQRASGPDEISSPPSYPLAQEVLIPSCIESAISGIMDSNVTDMWFSTTFTIPEAWNESGLKQVLLNFEAVDNQATVFVNGVSIGSNVGGYWRFTLDITSVLNLHLPNELVVFVHDPTDDPLERVPCGKQAKVPSHIFYTPCSGIWQTVWIEHAPLNHVTQLDVAADMHGLVNMTVHSYDSEPVSGSVMNETGAIVCNFTGSSNEPFQFQVDSPKLWSPDSPTLYTLTISMGEDEISSYAGFRTISSGKVNGVLRPLLNGDFVFQFGTLDQGFWPDGIYLAPTYEALVSDLKLLKSLGMNMLRKHIKVEPDLFYTACDQLGLLVIQDMPSMAPRDVAPTAEQQAEFERQVEVMINEHKSYPSIVTWVIYNEGWGQITGPYYPEFEITDMIRSIDPTRLVNAVTGWVDHGAGDFHDNHHYANPQCGTPFYSLASTPYDSDRIGFQGEFGGIGHNVSIEHLWNVQGAIDLINQTYEINADMEAYNYRAHVLLGELRDQIAKYACSGAVYTQTTDVEGEVNGLVTYDRRFQRAEATQWRRDIQALYDAASHRSAQDS